MNDRNVDETLTHNFPPEDRRPLSHHLRFRSEDKFNRRFDGNSHQGKLLIWFWQHRLGMYLFVEVLVAFGLFNPSFSTFWKKLCNSAYMHLYANMCLSTFTSGQSKVNYCCSHASTVSSNGSAHLEWGKMLFLNMHRHSLRRMPIRLEKLKNTPIALSAPRLQTLG